MPTTYTLAPEEEEAARRLVAEGRFANVAEVVRAGIERVVFEDDNLGYSSEELKRLVEEGEASGELTEEETEAAFARLKAKYAAMIPRRA
jgi:putative addiction module CopG family antidote